MAGKQGRSGRKARIDGKKMKAVSLYIEHEEIDVTPFGESAKYKWIPETRRNPHLYSCYPNPGSGQFDNNGNRHIHLRVLYN